MHVCLVTTKRPFDTCMGGEEKFTLSHACELMTRGIEVTVVARSLFGARAVRMAHSLKERKRSLARSQRVFHPSYPVVILSSFLVSLLIMLKIIETNRRSEISVIHSQDTGYGGLASIVAGKILRIPVLITSHGTRYNNLRTGAGYILKLLLPSEYALDKFTTTHADFLMLVSASQMQFFLKLGVKEKRIRIVPAGILRKNFIVDEEIRQEARKELGLDDEIAIGFVGRFAKEKNIWSLLHAFANCLAKNDKIRLVLVGTGVQEADLRAFSYREQLSDRVIFAGVRQDIEKILSALDVFVIPSYTEGCPLSLLEAMAAGKPIIASNLPSIKEIVKDNGAVLINPHNIADLEQAILSLTADSDLRSELGLRCKRIVMSYDITKVSGQVVDIYNSVRAKSEVPMVLSTRNLRKSVTSGL